MALDGSRFKAVNTRDKNYTPGAIRLRKEQVDASIARYLNMLDTADRQDDQIAELRVARLNERLEALRRQMRQLKAIEQVVTDAPDHQVSLTDPDARAMATNGKGTGKSSPARPPAGTGRVIAARAQSRPSAPRASNVASPAGNTRR